MAKKVTMSDIAEQLGVSTVTVSKALAGKEGVGETLRGKILTLADKMGYQGKAAAEDATGMTVGVLISERFLGKHDTFYWAMYERILDKLSTENLFGMVEPVSSRDEEEVVLPRLIQGGRVQALVVIGHLALSYLEALRALDIPVVQVDDYNPRAGLDTVISDGYYGMYITTDYLIRHGHRDIAYLGRVGATSSITDRYFGYCRALQENGIPLRDDWVISDRNDRGEWEFSLPREMPTAFVCNCDAVAYHLVRILEEKKFRVPGDISVVCFDNYLFSELSSPKITAYGVDVGGMAQTCVDQLRRRWADPQADRVIQVITGSLKEKESVKAL